jgi:1,4-dihydroxy-2-naphthoyl-CoA hydrolase
MLTEHFATGLSGWLAYHTLLIEPGRVQARLELRDELLMREGDYLHAGTVVTVADSVAGWGALASLPEHAEGFTTAEHKINLVATARGCDALLAVASLVHGGRTMQVWDVTVSREHDGRPVAHFRATQYLLNEER